MLYLALSADQAMLTRTAARVHTVALTSTLVLSPEAFTLALNSLANLIGISVGKDLKGMLTRVARYKVIILGTCKFSPHYQPLAVTDNLSP